MTAGAYLGGDLVYDEQIGIDHGEAKSLPRHFVPALAETELADGKLRRIEVKGTKVLLVRRGSNIYALGDTCSHLGCSLADGRLQDDSVVCPCHGSRFALRDGRVLDGPAVYPQPTLETRVQNGQIEVRASR